MFNVSLTTSFQAKAATRPKPDVASASICLMIACGRSFGFSGASIFFAIFLDHSVSLQ